MGRTQDHLPPSWFRVCWLGKIEDARFLNFPNVKFRRWTTTLKHLENSRFVGTSTNLNNKPQQPSLRAEQVTYPRLIERKLMFFFSNFSLLNFLNFELICKAFASELCGCTVCKKFTKLAILLASLIPAWLTGVDTGSTSTDIQWIFFVGSSSSKIILRLFLMPIDRLCGRCTRCSVLATIRLHIVIFSEDSPEPTASRSIRLNLQMLMKYS